MVHISKILYATDFSSYSNHAYFHALTLAETHSAQLTLAHVYIPSIGKSAEYWREQLESIQPGNPRMKVNHVFLQGDPAEEIIRHATNHGFDMIVLGTHGRTGDEHPLLGSVAERVLGGAPCSVMVVKLPRSIPVSPAIIIDHSV